jgi:hypothetical protein
MKGIDAIISENSSYRHIPAFGDEEYNSATHQAIGTLELEDASVYTDEACGEVG